ncbi:PAS domain-containing protein [Dongia deserti]|uniref:PAS domain-containing protein n=1 Tax=Dongia deserti TaxID=2268030 RepID=UPI000E647CD6|nr:PAS domain-containing protein [Dongia deserti]
MADPDFLADCHERVRAIYRYWDSKRKGRLMPARADLDPLDIPRLLPDICLVDVVPDERKYLYRLIGTNEAAMRGRDPTGLAVGDAYFGTSKQSVFLNYDAVTETRAPRLDRDPSITSDNRFIQHESIFLPLSDNGETVTMILVLTVYGPAPKKRF